MARHNETGKIGESVAANFLTKKGFCVICQNYRKKWGEIDIITEKDKILHFVEVKTVSRKSFGGHFEQEINNYRPEDNMHPWKIKRLQRAIQTYLLEKYPPSHKASAGQSKTSDPDWQFDLACVFLDQERRVAKVRFMENIIL
jgi:putative endonuclease